MKHSIPVSFVPPDSDPEAVEEDSWEKEIDSDAPVSDDASEPSQHESQELVVVPFPYSATFTPDLVHGPLVESQHSDHSPTVPRIPQSPLEQHNRTASGTACYLSPIEDAVHAHNPDTSPPTFWEPVSPFFQTVPAWPFQNAQEARLFHHYIRHLSTWV